MLPCISIEIEIILLIVESKETSMKINLSERLKRAIVAGATIYTYIEIYQE